MLEASFSAVPPALPDCSAEQPFFYPSILIALDASISSVSAAQARLDYVQMIFYGYKENNHPGRLGGHPSFWRRRGAYGDPLGLN